MAGFHGVGSGVGSSILSSSFSSMEKRRGCFLSRFGPALALDSDGIEGIPVNGPVLRHRSRCACCWLD